MEAVEFIRTIKKMCTGRHCDDCPLKENYKCNVIYTEDPEESVRIVEEWAKEHLETLDKERQKQEKDDVEGAIYRAIASNKTRIENLEYDVSVIRHNLSALHDKIYTLSEKVDHTPTAEPRQTQEPKRTNKDVLLAAFPDARMGDNGIPYACPNRLDAHYNCDKFENCLRCRYAHWLAEAEK